MKRIITYIAFLLIASAVFAQSSDLLSYQSIIRDNNQALVINQAVGVQVSILQGSQTGTLVYNEEQLSSTNINGLLSLQIGTASGFDTINWSQGPYFVQVEIDPTGGTNYTIVGKSQLLSVPFSLYSKRAEELVGPLPEIDPVFAASVAAGITEADTAYWNDKLDYEIDGDSTNELQNIYLHADTMVVLTDGGFFILPPETDPIFAASVAAGITEADTAYWNNKVGVEVDPVFAASIAYGITGMDTAYWNSKLDVEVDPIFAASVAAGITGADTAYWNNKVGVEVDPVFAASIAYGITGMDTAYWNSKLDVEVDPIFTSSIAYGITGLDTAYWNSKLDVEVDPIFAASIAYGITGLDTAYWNSKLDVEVDPIFAASVAAGITGADTANWNNKVGVEVDPVFAASIASGITGMDTAYWNSKLDVEVDPIFAASIAYGITGVDTAYWNSKLDAEVDPIFAASIASGITGADTANWNSKLDAEVDPIFAASIASGITGADTASWNSKLDVEVDPVFGSSVAAGITAADTALWNTDLVGDTSYFNYASQRLSAKPGVTSMEGIDTLVFENGNAALRTYGPFRLETFSGFEYRLTLGAVSSDFRNNIWYIRFLGGVNNDIMMEDHGTSFYTGFSATQALDVNGNILSRGSIMTDQITPFSASHVTIDDVIRLVPRASAPTPAQEGMIYSNSSDNHLYFYNGTTWVQLDN